jgi:general secretion pathway protein G
MNKPTQKAFTLIELLVVISIIGILATLVVANINSARSRARDAERKSDMKNIQTALRIYYNDYGVYPGSQVGGGNIKGCGLVGTTVCPWGNVWSVNNGATVYMATLPKDPISPTHYYKYTFVDSDNYILSACLENKSDANGVAESDTSWCPTGWKFEIKP